MLPRNGRTLHKLGIQPPHQLQNWLASRPQPHIHFKLMSFGCKVALGLRTILTPNLQRIKCSTTSKTQCTPETWKGIQEDEARKEEYRDTVRACRRRFRKAKAHVELNLVKNKKGRKNSFYKYIRNKRKTRENVGLLLNGMRNLVQKDIEKADVVNAFFSCYG